MTVVRSGASAVLVALCLPGLVGAETTLADAQTLLKKYCVECHGAETQEAGVNLTTLTDELGVLKERKFWKRTLGQVEVEAMPPADAEPQMTPDERAALVGWLKTALEGEKTLAALPPDPGPTLVRRLNRAEYNRSIRDLLGVEVDVASAVGLTDDVVVGTYDTLAEALHLTPTLMEKYFDAAQFALNRTIPENGDGPSGYFFPKEEAAYKRIFAERPGRNKPKAEIVKGWSTDFARRAYRRPVAEAEAERFLALFDAAEKSGLAYHQCVKLVLKTVLVSPNFLLRIERDRADESGPYRVSDQELAVRLSYFLWSSLPDDELTQAAEAGKLSDPAELEKQIRRMLADPKARALTDEFAAQWLQLRKLPDARPSQEFFPTFTRALREDMAEEASLFFDKLREEDGRLYDLLDGDYSYVNEDLAKHYGLKDVSGKEFRKVTFSPDQGRGGLLGMGAMLASTSHVSRTSPTLRGKWILEVVLGSPPPPPPANAGTLDESQKAGEEPKTFKELLARHASQTTCANCHKRIDPLGFGLENYDAVGRWRAKAGDDAIDATGQLPSGEVFSGPVELKKILVARKQEFGRNLVEQLLAYALGREVQYFDEPTVRAIHRSLEQSNGKFSTLVLGVATSYPFTHRKNSAVEE